MNETNLGEREMCGWDDGRRWKRRQFPSGPCNKPGGKTNTISRRAKRKKRTTRNIRNPLLDRCRRGPRNHRRESRCVERGEGRSACARAPDRIGIVWIQIWAMPPTVRVQSTARWFRGRCPGQEGPPEDGDERYRESDDATLHYCQR